jgi:hypothetical protein
MGKYDDIINLNRPVSTRHRPMPVENRAAQFMPFAALTGYDDEVSEAGRYTLDRIELSEDKKAEINERLLEIQEALLPHSAQSAVITYFVPDKNKNGGEYITDQVLIAKIVPQKKCLILDEKTEIKIEDILAIE